MLDCPGGTFLGAGVKTVVLFFEKGTPTRKVWYYQLDPGRSLGKTNSLNDDDLKEFVELQASFAESDKSWSVDVADIDPVSFDLSVKNPNKAEEAPLREPEEIIAEMVVLDAESADILEGIRGMLDEEGMADKRPWRVPRRSGETASTAKNPRQEWSRR